MTALAPHAMGPESAPVPEPVVGRARRPSPAAWAAAAVPLVVAGAFDPGGLRPATTLRWALVAVVVTAAVALPSAVDSRRLSRAAVGIAVALGGLLALATLVAVDPRIAVLGEPRRHLGLVGWGVLGLALVAGARLSRREVESLLAPACSAAALVTGVAGVADRLGWDPAGLRFAGGRVGGLVGQPTYLAALGLLLAPVAVGAALTPGARRAERLLGWSGATAATVAIALSGTRGALLGALVMAVMAAGPLVRLVRRRPLIALMGVAAFVALVAVAPVGGRLGSLADEGDGGGRSRVDEWVVALRVIGDHPLTGVGPDGYRVAAPAEIDAGYARRHGRAVVVDRAHSAPLDVAAAGGIPSAVAYVGLLGLVLVRGRRALDEGPVWAGIALGLAGWVGQQLVAFPIAEVDPAAWLLAGSLLAVPPMAPTWSRGMRAASAMVGVLLAVQGGRAVAADHLLARAQAVAARPGGEAVDLADRATRLQPDDLDAWYLAAHVAADQPGLTALDVGLERADAGLRRSPNDPALRALREDLLVQRALRSGLPADRRDALAASAAMVRLDPTGAVHWRNLGLVDGALGNQRAARSALLRAIDLDPHDATARAALAELGRRGS